MNALEQAEKLAEVASIKERGVPRTLAVTRLGELLEDSSGEVRAEAADAVWGYSDAPDLVRACLELARSDPMQGVRVRALGALGAVIREGELLGVEDPGYAPREDLGEPSSELYEQVKQHLVSVLSGTVEVERRAALASLAYLSRDEAVAQAIESLASGDDAGSRAVAIRCMGLSGDRRWAAAIREAVEGDDADVVSAGIVAAGQIEDVELVPLLARILRGDSQPASQRARAAAALGQLGGHNTASVLLEIAEDQEIDDALREAASAALNGLTLLNQEVTT